MPDAPQTMDVPGQNPDPVQLLKDLESMDTDQKKFNHLRDIFIEEADVDEYVQYLDTDEEIDLTGEQLAGLKATLAGFKVYLKRYLEKSAGRIGSLDERLKKSAEELANPELTPEEVDEISHTRRRVAQAMQIAKAPRGAKGKSLREATQTGGRPEAGSDELDAKYQEFIEGMGLSDKDTKKLKEMVSDANYQKAVEAAKELKASRIPTKAQILTELMKWKPEQLKDICEMQELPRVVIESDKSFDDQVAGMDAHKHYTAQNGKPQEDAYVYEGEKSPYRNISKSQKVKISITDGVVHPAQLKGVSTGLGARRKYLAEKYAEKKMKHASKGAMAALTQMSLLEAKETGDNNKIIDNWESGDGTATILDPDTLTESALVACSYFFSDLRRVVFSANSPELADGDVRGRASVQVLEI